jgi:hypothetical protein
MPAKQLVERRLVSGTGLFQEASGIGGAVVHVGPHSILTPDGGIIGTG